MSLKKTLTASVIASAVSLAAANANAADAEKKAAAKYEKCYGVAKAGHNDCHAADGSHACMGAAEMDADPNEWISVPTGLCEKLARGSLTPAATSADKPASDDEHEG